MEFFYDEQAVANEETSGKNHDERTDQVFHKLEDEVSKQYQRTTNVLKQMVKEDEQGVKVNLPLDPEVSETAQRYLKQLDNNLHNVENLALNYWTKVSDAGFWPSVTEKLGSKLEQLVSLDESPSGPQQSGKGAAGGNRTEAELRALSTDKSIYLNSKLEYSEEFDADAKTEEIAKILEQDKEMANLMNEVVPAEVSYKDFWRIYFTQRQRILEMEDKRKKLLAGKDSEVEEVGWDDEEADATEEEPVIVKKEDTMSVKTSEVKNVANDQGSQENRERPRDLVADEDEDEDEDWE